jgi:hypothetical protein
MNKNKDCPEGKVVNPITGRCVNICKVGTIRNKATGKCDKIPNGNDMQINIQMVVGPSA